MTNAEVAHKVITIAIKAHELNPSPVDIKTELAQLPLNQLHKLQEMAAQTIAEENNKDTDEPAR